MSRYPLGQPIRLSTTVRDVTGALVNATTLTLTVSKPDGTTQSYATPANDGTGLYHQDIPVADLGQSGRYTYRWTATGTGAGEQGDVFDVYDALQGAILSLSDAKNHLSSGNITTWTGDDDELRRFLAAVTEVIESKVGPCVRRTVTQRIADGNSGTLALTQFPVISVTSVTSVWTGGPSWTGSSLVLDGDAGTVTTQLGAVPFYYGPWDVVTVVGRKVISDRYLHASRELLRHLWETQRGQLESGPLAASMGETFATSGGWAFSIPNRVLELLGDHMTPAI